MAAEKKRFTGVMPALLTPYTEEGGVNTETARRLVTWQMEHGAMGFYVCGATGEGPAISVANRKAMLEAVVATVQGRVPVIAHVGAINCEDAFELARHATAAGADAVSSVPPTLFTNFGQRGIINYYKRLAANTDLPVLLYATSSTATLDINAIVSELLAVPNIVGLKDTRAQYYNMWKLRQLNGGDINIINGPDEMLACGLTMGADGGIGSTYNIMIPWYNELYRLFKAGDLAGVQAMQTRINKVIDVLLKWGCIRALKTYLSEQGFDMGPLLFPYEAMTAAEKAQFMAEMAAVFQFPA